MNSVQEHYNGHLAAIYTWMAGGRAAALERNRAFLAGRKIAGGKGEWAVDLGCGPGFQAIPLAEAGFRVLGLDFCEGLLEECRQQAGDLDVTLIRGDLRRFPAHLPEPAMVILCLGDTLTHLEKPADVQTLVEDASRNLLPGGRLVLTFRDYTRELAGAERFIPVRGDERRILTCFLEYQAGQVRVHDLLYERIDGEWKLRTSVYPKLRLAPGEVQEWMVQAGFELEENSVERGMCCLIGRK